VIAFSLAEVAEAVGGELTGDGSLVVSGSVLVDSRALGPGDLFVALPGERVDGADFVPAAAAAGAVAALTTRVDPALLDLLDMWPFNPAFVYNRAFDVLASNRIADAMFSKWTHSTNLMHVIFTEPDAQDFYCNWSLVAEDAVASFRHGFGLAPNDVRLRTVRDELLEASPAFAELWSRNDARRKALQSKMFRHPVVGVMSLTMQTFDVRSSPGQELVVYHAEPNSPSAEALSVLCSWAATG